MPRPRAPQFTLMDGAGKVTPLDGDLDYHPLCLAFPPLADDEQAALNADVEANGVREPGWLHEGKIIEGRHRHIAARASGRPMLFRQYAGTDPVGFVISANMRRRHMDATQRAMAVAKLEQLGQGGDRKSKTWRKVLTRAELVAVMQASTTSVERARIVHDKGAPELVDATMQSKVPVKVAAEIATLPQEEQRDLIAKGDEKAITAAYREIRDRKNAERREEKAALHIRQSQGDKPFEFDRRFIVASFDPPWRYERPLIGDSDRSIENKYKTMPFVDIEALPVHRFMAPASVIFLHIPQPLAICETPEGHCYPHQLGRAWGDPHWRDPDRCDPKLWFRPVAQIIWEKRSVDDIVNGGGPLGMGKIVRTDHECVVIMKRGNVVEPKFKPRSVYHIRSRGELEHSEKPAQIYEDIRRMYADYAKAGPFLAAFERKERPGFIVWGNEAPEAAAA